MILNKNKTENETITFELELLPGEAHNLNIITGQVNMFIDGWWKKFTRSLEKGVTSVVNPIVNAEEQGVEAGVSPVPGGG